MVKNIILISAIGAAILLGGAFAEAIEIKATGEVGATASKVEDIDTASPIMDNFNDGGNTNRWGGKTGSFTDEGKLGKCSALNDAVSPQEGDYCLKLTYDVKAPETYAGYFSELQAKDLSGYTAISFWVRGEAGGEYFKIELKNNNADKDRSHAAVYITDYLDGGVTAGWSKVTIPLHNFVNLDDLTSMKEFVIVFENSQCSINKSPKESTVYIDEISFSKAPVNIVRIDHFGDMLGTCALGGNIGDMADGGGTAAHSFTSPPDVWAYHNSSHGLLSTYDVRPGPAWSGNFIIFGGGDDGWTAIPHDFSEFGYLSLYINVWYPTLGDPKNPKVVKIELADKVATRSHIITGISPGWKKYKIPLADFAGLDKTSIKQMNIVYVGGRIGEAGGDKWGGICIDEIQFEK